MARPTPPSSTSRAKPSGTTPTPPRPAAPKPPAPFKVDDSRYAGLPNYIAGLVDPGGESYMLAAGKPGWVMLNAVVNPPDSSGDYSSYIDKGIGVIVTLHNGTGRHGTIPNPTDFEFFAQHCANFVRRSRGARVWMIGNTPNAARSRPGNDGASNSGELITPELYATCFNKVRRAIRGVTGHENDWIVPAAILPFNTQTTYPGNPSGDWVRYFADMLFQVTVQGGGLDGIALNAFTHGYDATFVTSDAKASGNFSNRHWHFRTYRDFLTAILPTLRNLPVFITAAAPLEPGWTNANRGWMQAALTEVNLWNSSPTNQPIQAVCFHRWQSAPGDPPGWSIADKPQVLQDLRAALNNDFRLRWPGMQPTPDYRAQWISTVSIPSSTLTTNEVITGRVVVKNTGAKAWLAAGSNPVRLGYRWFNAQGVEIPLQPPAEHFTLPQNVLPGQTAILDNVKLRAPQWQGEYVVRFDMIQEGSAWFSVLNSPTRDFSITVQAPPYAAEWERVITVPQNSMATNANLIGAVMVKNLGSRTWHKSGPNNVRLAYHWFNAQGNPVAVTPYAGPFEMDADTPPGKTAVFSNVVLRSPQWEGAFTLRWDLNQEGITWFSQQGVETFDQVVNVFVPIPDYAVKWINLFIDIRGTLEPNETVTGTITIQNVGAKTWQASGENPIKLGYHWYDAEHNTVGITPYAGNFSLPHDVPPQSMAIIENVVVRAPIPQAKYTLSFDLVHEGVTWFANAGSKPFEVQVAVKTDAPPYLAQWQELVEIPNNLITAGETVTGRVVVRNAGANVWDNDGTNAVRLGYRWFNLAGEQVRAPTYPGYLRLPQAVPPRDPITIEDVVIHTPATPGDYTLKFDLVRGINGWFSDDASPTADVAVRIKAPPLEWGAEFVAHNNPAHLVAGQTVEVALRIANTGKRTWNANGNHPVHAAYQWINATGIQVFDVQEFRTGLPRDLAPGDETDFAASLAAPNTPGVYRLHWDLIAEGISWFADGGNPALVIPVNVTLTANASNLWRAEASHNGASAILSIDGDLGSFWSAQAPQAPGMWFRADLGAPQMIDGIAYRSPGKGHPFAYTLRISPDGQTWRTVWGVAQGNARDVVAYFAPFAVQYAQIDLLAPAPDEWMIGEVQVHLSPGWHATASNNNEYANNAIDNNPTTAWTTVDTQAPNMWFQLDLGRVESVSGLRLIPPKDEIPRGYRVSVWNHQAGGWQKISEKLNNTEPINISFAPVQTQYINLQLLQTSELPFAVREARVIKAMTAWQSPTRPPNG